MSDAVYYKDGKPVNGWIDQLGVKKHFVDGRLHCDDGPALISSAVSTWYQHGKRHREDGPAYEWDDGRVQWWLNDMEYRFDSWLNSVDLSDEDRTLLKLEWG